MRHVVVCLGFVSLVATGVGLNACAESTDGSGLNPQPLPPDEKSPGSSGETPAREDPGDTEGSSGGMTGSASGDAGVDGSPSGDGG